MVENQPVNEGDMGSIPGSGRSGEGNGHPLQYSCLENPMDRGGWRATVHRIAESYTTERLHFHFRMLNNTDICCITSNSVVLCSAGTLLSKTNLLFHFFSIKQLWLMQSNA